MRPLHGIAIVVALMALVPMTLEATQTDNDLGGASALWLKIPTSVRGEGMAQATVAQDGVDNMDLNPTALSGIEAQEFSIGHNAWIQDTSLENAAYGLRVDNSTVVGLSFNYFDFGSVNAYTVNTSTNQISANGSFTPYGDSVSMAVSQSLLGNIDIGLALRYVGESEDGVTDNSGFTGDLGAKWCMGDWRVAASFLDAVGQLEGANFPSSFNAGIAWSQPIDTNSINIEADMEAPFVDASGTTFSVGGEFWWNNRFAARLGYKMGNSDVQSAGSGLTAGMGARLGMAELNYAYISAGDLGSSNQLQLLLRFGSVLIAAPANAEATPVPAASTPMTSAPTSVPATSNNPTTH